VEASREEWDRFVAAAPSCPILQSWEWGEVKAAQGWEPIRLAIKDDQKMIAAASILKRKLPYIGKSIFYVPRGPVCDFNDSEALNFLLKAIKEKAREHQALLLKIDPEIEEEKTSTIKILSKNGFHVQKKQVQPRATIFLDLTKSLDELLMSFEEKTRYNIRLSEKKGVRVAEEATSRGVDIFYEQYRETARRDEFLIHPKIYYQKVLECLNQKNLARIFVAYLDKTPIASVWIFCFGSRIWYMYGASSSEHRNVMPNHALHWEVIKWAKVHGYKIYDLWGIPANPQENHPLLGVYRFKKGFNGKLMKFAGAMDLVYNPIFYFLFDKGLNLYKNLRSLLTKGRVEDSLGE
jgi:lipid II:glycine glycyltransferase (peptidoglycan interpeptide bridge formation enzyme)